MTGDDAITADAFLGGRLTILQPRRGYRAGADAVFLAAAVPARAGDRVLELGCGVGAAGLCLVARVRGIILTGVEREPQAAALARRNAAATGLPFEVVEADIGQLPADLRTQAFDHVMLNPPYFTSGPPAGNAARAGARHEDTPLNAWIDTAVRRLRPGGQLTLIQAVDRVPDIFRACDTRLGSLTLRPLVPRDGRPAGRVIVTGRKGGRAAFALLPPFVLHSGPAHEADADSYPPRAQAILRDGAAFD
jgi:tRNA1(Val) A37 N6-methylase TrmN6